MLIRSFFYELFLLVFKVPKYKEHVLAQQIHT